MGAFLGAGAEGLEGGEAMPAKPAGAPLAGLRTPAGLGSAEKFPPAWKLGGPVAYKSHANKTGPTAARMTRQYATMAATSVM